jgi:hypothetical protein
MTGPSCGLIPTVHRWLQWRRFVLFGLGIALAGLAASAAPAASTGYDIQKRMASIAKDQGLQLQLPGPGQQPEEFSLPNIPIPPFVIWAVLGASGLFLLYYIGRELAQSWRRSSQDEPLAAAAAGVLSASPSAEAAVEAAEALAREGRFVEAMHVLLLKGLADLRTRLDIQIAESLTSREILRRVSLTESGRAALRDIVARVEWTYFGENPAEAADYAICRNRFDVLMAALQAGAAR